MTYPAETTTKSERVLEALRANLEALAPPTAFFDVKSAQIFGGAQLVLGREMPAIAIVPAADEKLRSLACAEDEWQLTVAIVGALRVPPDTSDWKAQIRRFAADIQQAINDDIQLGGLAVYIEADRIDIGDAEMEGGRRLAICEVTARIVYRVSFTDVTV